MINNDILKALNQETYKDKDIELYTQKEFLYFIKESKTINLYKDIFSTFLIDKIYNNKKSDFNYELMGRLFIALFLQAIDGNIKTSEILKSKKDLELFEELKNIYYKTMIKPYKKAINGEKGGAPKGNKNAKKQELEPSEKEPQLIPPNENPNKKITNKEQLINFYTLLKNENEEILNNETKDNIILSHFLQCLENNEMITNGIVFCYTEQNYNKIKL